MQLKKVSIQTNTDIDAWCGHLHRIEILHMQKPQNHQFDSTLAAIRAQIASLATTVYCLTGWLPL